MAFYKSKRRLINSILSLMSLIAIGLAFQNCSNGFSSSSPALSNATSDTPGGMRVISDDNTGSNTTTGSTELKIELLATDLLKVDCSLPGSGYKFEISNASTDITMCQEYTLDMPQGNSRYGESYKCDSSDKFVSPASAWSYDVGQRKWSKITYTNAQQYIPGDYRLYVRDSRGEVKSSLLKIRHYGYANCENPNPVIAEQPGTGGGSVNTGGGGSSGGGGTTSVVTSCSWSGEDFSPAKPPQSVCSQSRANAKENGASGVEYTCVCSQATVVVPPSSGGGSGVSPAPTPSPGSGVQGAACNPVGTELVEVDTGPPDMAYPRTNFRPTPSTVYAFAFKTKTNGEMYTGRFTVNKLSSAISGKLIVISRCRGDVSTVLNEEKTQGCLMFGSETATLGYVVDVTSAYKPLYYCNLKPNTQYYLNVIGRDSAESANLCENTSVCGFDFERQ